MLALPSNSNNSPLEFFHVTICPAEHFIFTPANAFANSVVLVEVFDVLYTNHIIDLISVKSYTHSISHIVIRSI